MRIAASFESALSRLATWRRTAARLRARDLARVLGGVAAVLFALELVYLVVGNAIIRSDLIKAAVASAEGFHLDYGRAYTLWPGRVRIENFSLRAEDYNVQFELTFDDADVDIALGQLPFKKFRATRLDARGTRFRARHKLIVVGDDAERVAAYPPIRGFADPPYYVGLRPPPIPDEEYDLWEVRVDSVRADVKELWLLEQRFRGESEARGAFVIRPARWVQVDRAALRIESGSLTLGEHRVARQVRGRIRFDLPDMQVQSVEGREVFREISSSLELKLTGGELDFLRAYLARLGSTRYSGAADFEIDLNVQRGVVQPGSRISALARPLVLRHDFAELAGDVMLSFGREAQQSPEQLLLAASAPRLTARRAGASAPPISLEGLRGSLHLNAIDLAGDLSLGAWQAALQRLHVPSLAWFRTSGLDLSGAATGELHVAQDDARRLSGRAALRVTDGVIRHGALGAAGDLRGKLAFSSAGAGAALRASELGLWLDDATLRSGDERSEPFSVSVDGAGLWVKPGPPLEARGDVRAKVSSAEALLPLVVANPWKGLGAAALGLDALQARASLELRGEDVDIERIDATSGNLRVRGYLRKRAAGQRGAFLLSSGPIHVGLTLRAGTTEVTPFVSGDWLAASAPKAPATVTVAASEP